MVYYNQTMSDTTAKKTGLLLGIAVHQESIVVAQNKNLELFVKNFRYESENVTAKHLGQIFGFFEIPEISDDNAYIVNFLASVVKKEYFQNPRRSANESFEAALHKINLALTELVKQGNTSWLGHLEGAVAVVENDTLHFSVTGDAAIFLYRNGEATLVSEGLADRDAASHPLKTFLEISSGKLLPGDTLLVSSPELFSLCSEELLLKNVSRMNTDAFVRFVRTALVNELDLASSTILTVHEAAKEKVASKRGTLLEEASKIKLQNVFSNASFQAPRKALVVEAPSTQAGETLPTEEFREESGEYTDEKTGHIYVQGDTFGSPYQESSRLRLAMTETWAALSFTCKRGFKRWSKKSKKAALAGVVELSATAGVIKTKGVRSARQTSRHLLEASLSFLQDQKRTLRKFFLKQQAKRSAKKLALVTKAESGPIYSGFSKNISDSPLPFARKDASAPSSNSSLPAEESSFTDSPTSQESSVASRLAAFSVDAPPRSTQVTRKVRGHKSFFTVIERILETTSSGLSSFFKTGALLVRKNPLLLFAILLLCVIALGAFFWLERKTPEVTPPVASTGENSIAALEETPAPQGSGSSPEQIPVGQYEGALVGLITTDDATYFIQKNAIRSGDNQWSQADIGNFVLATYMKDLRLIFLWTDQNTLVSFSTVDKKFVRNNLPLPAGASVTNIGAYLTYLYVLDSKQGTIYRFPRTEGGFAEGTNWLKSPLEEKEGISLAVSDTIRIGGKTVKQYLKGDLEKTLSDEPHSLLATSSNGTFILGVATGTDKLTVWNADGTTVLTKSLPAIQSASKMSYDENAKKLYIAKEGQVQSQDLSW
jgi:hypothetical protein